MEISDVLGTRDPLPTTPFRAEALPYEPAAATDPLAGLGVRTSFGRGQSLVLEGDPADHCFKILSGVVVVHKLLLDGRRQITDFLVAGDVFGLGEGEDYAFSAESVTEVVATRYPRHAIDRAARSNGAVACWLFEAVSRSLSAAQVQIVLLGSKNALERVASFLLVFAGRQSAPCSVDAPLRLPMRRKDIADHLGLTIETVSRMFTVLKNAGAIELHHHDEVTFRDRSTLEQLAERGAALD